MVIEKEGGKDFWGSYVPSYTYEASIDPDDKSPEQTKFSVKQYPKPIEEVVVAKTADKALGEIESWRFMNNFMCGVGLLVASGAVVDGTIRIIQAATTNERDPWISLALAEIVAGLSFGFERFRSLRRKENRLAYLENFIRDRVWQVAKPVLHHSPGQNDPTA